MSKKINLTLKIWRQKNHASLGKFEVYQTKGVDTDMSFLKMLDMLNEKLTKEGREPIAFDHDCSDGTCGKCGAVINGQPYGPIRGVSLCQLYMRHFKDGETLFIEPWRAKAFPINKDLSVDRSAFDRIITAGELLLVKTGQAPDAHSMDAAPCIDCGACVAACPNASAMLFVAAKVSHLNALPQGALEKKTRMLNMIKQMDKEGFGNCSNSYECEAACPKKISVTYIAQMNRDYRQVNIA